MITQQSLLGMKEVKHMLIRQCPLIFSDPYTVLQHCPSHYHLLHLSVVKGILEINIC